MTTQLTTIAETNTDVVNVSSFSEKFLAVLLQYITSSPYILFTVALAYLSGNLWVYIILSYCSKRGQKYLGSLVSKIGLGLLWFALIMIPIYNCVHRKFTIEILLLPQIIATVWVLSFAMQAIVFIVVYFVYRKKEVKNENH